MLDVNGIEFRCYTDARDVKNGYGFFPDGTLLMRFDVDADTDDVQYRINWQFASVIEEVVLRNLVLHIKEKNPGARNTLRMDYVSNARMDRAEDPDDVFTLKYFIKLINSLNFHRVYITDPHSGVTTALLNRVHVDVVQLERLIEHVMDEVNPTLVCYPDAGAKKRLEKHIMFPSVYAEKKRNWRTGEIEGTILHNPDNHGLEKATFVIFDDISSYGGTFKFVGQELHNAGAESVYLCVTHCENTILKGDLINSGLMKGIFTTASIYTGNHPLIKIVEV